MSVIAAGQLLAGRYALDRELGRGGMGSVWSALDQKLQRTVAVKVMTARIATSATALARFEREAMAVAKLRTPHIVEVYDYGVDDDIPYIVMELLEGQDLKQHLRKQGQLSLAETATLLVPIAKGLAAAHRHGLVHRDLKPANIFLARDGEELFPKVFDFGVAKALADEDTEDSTVEGALLGTPRYMSPEQAHGAKQVDGRTDVWAFAAIVYECLTGRPAFDAKGQGHILVQVCTEEPPSALDFAPNLTPAVDAFLRKGLQKNLDERFGSAKEIGRALAKLAGQPAGSAPSLSDDDSLGFANRHGTGSWDDSSRGVATAPDLTLGPATRTGRPPSSQRGGAKRWLWGLAALTAASVFGFVGFRKTEPVTDPGGATSPVAIASENVSPSDSIGDGDGDSAATTPAAPSAAPDAPSTKSKTQAPAAKRRRPPQVKVVAPAPSAKASVAAPVPRPPPPPPRPKPKPASGDGLDLFKGRH